MTPPMRISSLKWGDYSTLDAGGQLLASVGLSHRGNAGEPFAFRAGVFCRPTECPRPLQNQLGGSDNSFPAATCLLPYGLGRPPGAPLALAAVASP